MDITILECPVCLDYFRDPRILTNCGHTLCTECIIDIISTNSNNIELYIDIECPTCSKKTIIEDSDISCLKRNYTVNDIVESIKHIKQDNNLSKSAPISKIKNLRYNKDIEEKETLIYNQKINEKINKQKQTNNTIITEVNYINDNDLIFEIEETTSNRNRECCNLLDGPFSAPN